MATRRRSARTAAAPDKTAARELDLYAENERDLYNQYQSILKNLLLKLRRGVYSATLAPKLWAYWFEAAAKKYAKEFGGGVPWNVTFTKATRDFAAKQRAEQEERALRSGEHDYLLQTPAARQAEMAKTSSAASAWLK